MSVVDNGWPWECRSQWRESQLEISIGHCLYMVVIRPVVWTVPFTCQDRVFATEVSHRHMRMFII